MFSSTTNPIQQGSSEMRILLEKPELCFFFFYRHLLDLPLRKKSIELWIEKLPRSLPLFETYILYYLNMTNKIPQTMSPCLQSVFRKWIVAQTTSIHGIEIQPFEAVYKFPKIQEEYFVKKWKKTQLHFLQSIHHSTKSMNKVQEHEQKQPQLEEVQEQVPTGMTGFFGLFKGGAEETTMNKNQQMSRNTELLRILSKKQDEVRSPKYQPLLKMEDIPWLESWLGWTIKENKNTWNNDEWNFGMFERRVRWYQDTKEEDIEALIYILEHQTFKSYQDIFFFYFTIGFPIEYEFPFFVYLLHTEQSWKRQYKIFPVPDNNTEQYLWYLASCLYYLHKELGSGFIRHMYSFYNRKEKFSLEAILGKKHGKKK
jgi:DNA-binding transcriptional regulator GbsR (MarR family)